MGARTSTVMRETWIGGWPEPIYNEIADFRRWTHWSPWEDLDPALMRDYSGARSGTGAEYRWWGNRRVGQGSMKIIEASVNSDDALVRIELVFELPWPSRNETVFDIRFERGMCRVQWSLTGDRTRAAGLLGPLGSRRVRRDLGRGLTRLKAILDPWVRPEL
jgi:hypothetical protein